MGDSSKAAMYLRGTLGFHVECPLDDMARRVSEEWHRRTAECQEHRQQITDLRRQLGEAKECMRRDAKDIADLQGDNTDLQAEVERLKADIAERNIDIIGADAVTDMAALQRRHDALREALEWLRARPCIHSNLREGFGVGCSFCRADAALQGIDWHSMMEGVRVPPDRLRAALDEKGDR